MKIGYLKGSNMDEFLKEKLSAFACDKVVIDNALLLVPAGKVGEYGFARVWERFGNIEEIA